MTDPIAPAPSNAPTDQTNPRDAGHTTSENFWTKVTMILGIVISVGGFTADAISAVAGVVPAGSKVFQYAGFVGAGVALISKISYEIQRTLIKLKLVDAEIAASKLPPSAKTSPDEAAANVLGSDAPQG